MLTFLEHLLSQNLIAVFPTAYTQHVSNVNFGINLSYDQTGGNFHFLTSLAFVAHLHNHHLHVMLITKQLELTQLDQIWAKDGLFRP